MEELPRQVPREHPGLRTAQRGNFISVRQKPDQDGGWGTLLNPKRFELPLLTPHRLKSRLGYEAVPASEFWQFSVSGRVRLQVNRLSADRYASSVGLALLDQNNRRVAPLVQSASGRGEAVEIGPGTYKVVASLGIAENLKDLVFEFSATPIGGRLLAAAAAALQGSGQLLGGGRHQLSGSAALSGAGFGVLRRPQLQGATAAVVAGAGRLGGGGSLLQGRGVISAASSALLRGGAVAALRGSGALQGTAAAQPRAVRWLADPDGNWRARVVGDVVELNRSYVRFAVDAATQQQLLAQLAAALH
jgi:hypothetical protein